MKTKIIPNVEFDVIYADGTRKRVQEGVCFEAEADGSITFHNGTDRYAVLLAATETALVAVSKIGTGLAGLAIAMAIRDETRDVLRDLSWFANDLLEDRSAQEQGIFRLGQMDLRASACDMLRAMANGAAPQIRPGLILAADLVESMEVSHANS